MSVYADTQDAVRKMCLVAMAGEAGLPKALMKNRHAIGGFENNTFDESYISFLDEQIAANARGEDWAERIRRRRENLQDYCGIPLVNCFVLTRDQRYEMKVYLDTLKLVHWESYGRHDRDDTYR